MHPPRPKRVLRGPQFVDQLAEWLLRHCPFTAVSLLILLVAGSAIPFPRPLLLVTVVGATDVAINLFRDWRKPRREQRSSLTRTNVTA